jgi:hypothetical protein
MLLVEIFFGRRAHGAHPHQAHDAYGQRHQGGHADGEEDFDVDAEVGVRRPAGRGWAGRAGEGHRAHEIFFRAKV